MRQLFGTVLMPWRLAAVLGPGLLVVLLMLSGHATPTRARDPSVAQPAPAAAADEFVGPFASWADVKANYGAIGDGSADDTGALQRAFEELGTPGHAAVLYLPAGVYRITRTLNLAAKLHVSILGEHPARTIVRWGGSAGGDMLNVNGVSHSRYGRITWDGAGTAGAIYNLGWLREGKYFPTLNEHADEVFQDAAYGIRAGTRGGGDAETSVLQCRFLRLSQAGLSLENFNVLDWWVWDSQFEDNEVGVTNTHGAGNFYVYNSVFKRSRYADLSIGNTGFFSFRRNYSVGSNKFFLAGPIGSAAAAITFQGNTILDPASRAIETYNPGPQLLLDNTIRSTGDPPVKLSEPYLISPATADVVGLGNTFSTPNPYDVAGRLVSVDDQVVDAGTIDAPEPALPDVPPNLNRRVVEVAPGSDGNVIQSAINAAIAQAGGTRPVVHLPPGTYALTTPLTIPAGSDVQLVGDGGTTILAWNGTSSGPVVHLNGPSHATLRDLAVQANGSDGVLVDNADQAGASVFLQSPNVDRAEVGLYVANLGQADVCVHDLEGNANKLHLRAGAARAVVFGGAAGNDERTFDVAAGGSLVVEDLWHEGGQPGAIHLTDSGSFTLDGSNIAGSPTSGVPTVSTAGFRGRMTLATVITAQGIQFAVQPPGTGTQALFVGIEGRVTDPFYFNSTSDAQAALIGSKLGDARGGSAPVPDQVSNVASVPDFLRTMLTDLRHAQPHSLSATAPDVTDVRLFRVFVDQARTAIAVQGPAS